jgi:hypothetical protein
MVPHLNCVSTSTAAKLDGMDNKEWQARKEAATPRGASALQSFFAARTQNAELWDIEGGQFIDFAGGIGCKESAPRRRSKACNDCSTRTSNPSALQRSCTSPCKARVVSTQSPDGMTNGRNAWALRFMCALHAAQIGASHFLPIFYRAAETGYVRMLTKVG